MIVMCAVPRVGEAQGSTPAANTVAIGGDIGFMATHYSEEAAAFEIDAFVEYYYTGRVSVRGQYGWSRTDLQAAPQRSVRRQHVLLSVIYNIELGRFRPYATVGGGA